MAAPWSQYEQARLTARGKERLRLLKLTNLQKKSFCKKKVAESGENTVSAGAESWRIRQSLSEKRRQMEQALRKKGDTKLEHKLLSIKKSRLLLDHRVNDALTVLRQKSGNGEQMYNVIYQTFIAPDKLTHANILSIRLWTAPAGCLDAWLEMLTLLEDS